MTHNLRNLGKIATLLNNSMIAEADCHDDVDAFHAPSECHGLVAKGCQRDQHELVLAIERATGYDAQELIDEFKRRCSGKWLHHYGILIPLIDMATWRRDQAAEREMLRYGNRARLP